MRQNNYFPSQRVSADVKETFEFYSACTDYVIAAGQACNDRAATENLLAILHGDIPDEYYKKATNPYNASKEKFTRFPATMRNLDIINDIVRRYVSEYIKEDHEFIVGANNPDIILARDKAIRDDILKKANEVYMAELKAKITQAEAQNAQAEAQGQAPKAINPDELMGDPEAYAKEFASKYIDEISSQGQQLLNIIDDVVKTETIIPQAYFNWVVTGECYTYHTVRNNKLIKEVVPTTEMYPVPNGKQFVGEYDMCARELNMTRSQILDMFGDDLSDSDLEFIEKYYSPTSTAALTLDAYSYHFPERCAKLTDEDRGLFLSGKINLYEGNPDIIKVWHATWRGEAKQGILTHINESSIIEETVVDESFVFDESLGHISIEWIYKEQIYESYRIGLRSSIGIYPIKCRPVVYQGNPAKLPYTGVQEILPQMGQFSIVRILVPFQILINIFSYHREMMIAKNKMFILLVAKSLLGNDAEETIYRMAAEGVLMYDDSEDANAMKVAQIRMLNANINGYIQELSTLIDDIKNSARDMVDMTPQRYGQISNSAGKGVTDEAIARGSMGSVLIVHMFNKFREEDYAIDMDNSKFAWIDGLDTSYFDSQRERKYLSLDVNSHVYAQYMIRAKNSTREAEKLKQIQQWAFSAAQNGDMEMALAAITGDNVSSIKTAVEKFSELKRKNEESLKQLDMELEDKKHQSILEQIAAKGEQDRLTEEVKAYYNLQSRSMDIAANLNSNKETTSPDPANMAKVDIEREKLNNEITNKQLDFMNAALDRNVKREEMLSKEKIAKENKNRFDSNKSKK